MSTLQAGKDKIKEICETLKKEALDPAKKESEQLLAQAQKKADSLLEKAQEDAETLMKEAKNKIEQERSVFESSLKQATQQSLETLRQDIEEKLFKRELDASINEDMASASFVGTLLKALVEAIEKDGITANLQAVISKNTNPDEAAQELGTSAAAKILKENISVGSFAGGAQLKVKDRQFTLDMSDQALKEMLAQYLRKDFRNWLFQS
jgi:V/A-type H+-transporting ATPase subunit E